MCVCDIYLSSGNMHLSSMTSMFSDPGPVILSEIGNSEARGEGRHPLLHALCKSISGFVQLVRARNSGGIFVYFGSYLKNFDGGTEARTPNPIRTHGNPRITSPGHHRSCYPAVEYAGGGAGSRTRLDKNCESCG